MSAHSPDEVAPLSRPAPSSAIRTLLLGGCQVASLGKELDGACGSVQLWRAPTIALMSEPIRPIGTLGFDDRHSGYILDDCAKTHLAILQDAEFDVLVFEVARDVRCPLIRSGDTYLFDPNRMHFRVADAPPPEERSIDVGALLGDTEVTPFEALDPRFFATWAEYFDRFYDAVLAPRILNGCIVILQKLYLAKQTVPPSYLFRDLWDYCDALNALLRRMHARIASYSGIHLVGFDEARYVTAADAPFGGPYITHPVKEVFALMADQVRTIIAREQIRFPKWEADTWFLKTDSV